MTSNKLKRILIFVATMVVAVDVNSMSIAITALAQTYATSVEQTQWLLTAYMLTQASTVLAFARWGDSVGHGFIFRWGTLTFFCSAVLAVFAPSLEIQIFARVLTALGAGMIVAAGIPLITELFGEDQKPKAVAFLTSASSLGAIFGPLSAGFLIELAGRHGAFLTAAVLMGAVSIPSFSSFGKKKKANQQGKADLLGAVLIAIATGSAVYGIRGDFGWLILTAIALGALYLRYGSQIKDFPERREVFGALIITMATFAAVFFHVVIPIFLQRELQLSPGLIGFVMILYPLSIFIGTRAASMITRSLTEWKGAAIGLILIISGLASMGLMASEAGLAVASFSLLASGFGLGLFIPFNSSKLLNLFHTSRRGFAGGLIASFRSFGIAVGVSISVSLQAGFDSYRLAFLVGTGFAIFALLLVCLIYTPRTKQISN